MNKVTKMAVSKEIKMVMTKVKTKTKMKLEILIAIKVKLDQMMNHQGINQLILVRRIN
ncbi:hypothetical protein SDC9_163640 [bioreactor metagenome]|uniref:Uncharacterized protein n=1 Tax=bioreactor metagenome TaxID=1076179 RepID=A0A645FRQ9_9ZZZZ